MKNTPSGGRAQASLFKCVGCGVLCDDSASFTESNGCIAFACHSCTWRAKRSPRFAEQLDSTVGAKVLLSEVQRIFASLGMSDVPTSALDELDKAFGLPSGSCAAAFGGVS
jgi:hypothetical protein